MEFLKELFGDEALNFEQFTAKAAEKKMRLADLSGGEYVGKGKFDALSEEKGVLKEQLAAANKQIEEFRGLDVEGVQRKADEWKAKFEQAEKDAQARIDKLQFDHALEAALSGAKARNTKAVAALLDMDSLKLADGKLEGLDKQLEAIRADNGYLFEDETQKPQFSAPFHQAGGSDLDAVRAVMGLPPTEKG